MLRESVTLLEPALDGAPDDLDLLSTMVCALGRLAEIQRNLTTASPHSRPAAERTVARGLVPADRAWALRLGDWRFASRHVRTLVVQGSAAARRGPLAARPGGAGPGLGAMRCGAVPDARRRAAWFEVQCATALRALSRTDEARRRALAAAAALAPLQAAPA